MPSLLDSHNRCELAHDINGIVDQFIVVLHPTMRVRWVCLDTEYPVGMECVPRKKFNNNKGIERTNGLFVEPRPQLARHSSQSLRLFWIPLFGISELADADGFDELRCDYPRTYFGIEDTCAEFFGRSARCF